MNLDNASSLASGVQVVDCLLDSLTDRAHGYDDVLGLGVAVVVERVILPAGELFDLLHILLDDVGYDCIEPVSSLLGLEEDVRVLCRPLLEGALRIHRASSELRECIVVHELRKVLILQFVDLLNLVRCPEAVEEVNEGEAPLDGGQVGDRRKVHDLLHAA